MAAHSNAAPVKQSDINHGDVAVTQMRKVIAKRLGESKFTAPHFYLTTEINMDKAMKHNEAINQVSDVKNFNDFIVKIYCINT